MRNRRIAVAIDMIADGEIGVMEAAMLAGTSHTNISHYLARHGINPRVRMDARHAWVNARWEQKLTKMLVAQATTVVDLSSKMHVIW